MQSIKYSAHPKWLVPAELSKKLFGPLKLALQMVVIHLVGAWNRTQVLFKSSKRS